MKRFFYYLFAWVIVLPVVIVLAVVLFPLILIGAAFAWNDPTLHNVNLNSTQGR